jgi:hypothetical protein
MTRVWAVSTLSDLFTNYVSYSYVTDTKDGSDYGGNTNLALSHRCKAKFDYETRPDIRTRYVAGYKVAYNKRLASITAIISGGTVYKYNLAYDSAPLTSKSRLVSLTLSDPAGNFVDPLLFKWIDGHPKVYDKLETMSTLSTNNSSGAAMLLDVNASGRSDIVVASKSRNNLHLHVFPTSGEGIVSTSSASGSGDTGLKYTDLLFPIEGRGGGRTDLVRLMNLFVLDSIIYFLLASHQRQC